MPTSARVSPAAVDFVPVIVNKHVSLQILPEHRPIVGSTLLASIDVHFLGPTGFMRVIERHLAALGVPGAQVRPEIFGPAQALD